MFFGVAQTAQKLKNNQGSITFFLQLQIELFFCPQRYYIVPPLRNSETHSCFWWRESLPKLSKNPFWNFSPLGAKVKQVHVLNKYLLSFKKL